MSLLTKRAQAAPHVTLVPWLDLEKDHRELGQPGKLYTFTVFDGGKKVAHLRKLNLPTGAGAGVSIATSRGGRSRPKAMIYFDGALPVKISYLAGVALGVRETCSNASPVFGIKRTPPGGWALVLTDLDGNKVDPVQVSVGCDPDHRHFQCAVRTAVRVARNPELRVELVLPSTCTAQVQNRQACRCGR